MAGKLETTKEERAEWAARAEQCGPLHRPVSLSWQQSHRLICDVGRLVELLRDGVISLDPNEETKWAKAARELLQEQGE